MHHSGVGELYAAVLDQQFQSSFVILLLSSHSSLVETLPLQTLPKQTATLHFLLKTKRFSLTTSDMFV